MSILKDERDLRDPQILGVFILEIHESYKHKSFHEIADRMADRFVPNYPQDESMASVTAREYRRELEERRAAGDKYAASALESLDKKGRVEGYDGVG